MRTPTRIGAGLLACAAAFGLAACGGDPSGQQAYDTKVAVYIGTPLGGPWDDAGLALTRGAVLGLADSGGGAGPFSVRLSLRDVTNDDLRTVGAQGASREAGNALRDVGAVGVIGGVDPTTGRQLLLLGNQTGLGYIQASGDQIDAPAADLEPQGRRMSVQLAAPDLAIARGLVERVRAADCRRTVLVDVSGSGVGAAHDAAGLDPDAVLRATGYRSPTLAQDLARELRRDTDCVAVTGEPSGGDPAELLGPLAAELADVTVLLTRGAASPAMATLTRDEDLTVEAIVDDPPADASAETERIDAKYREIYGTPAPVGVMAGWRSIKLMLRAIQDAGPGGNRRDSVAAALVKAPVPGPPAPGTQNPNGTVSNPSVSLATAQPYGWRAERSLGGS